MIGEFCSLFCPVRSIHLLQRLGHKSPQLRLRSLCAPGCGLEPQGFYDQISINISHKRRKKENQICDLTKSDLVSHESWQIRTQIHMSTCLHSDFNYTPATPGWIKWLIYTKRGWTQQFPIKTMFGINDCEPARIKPLQASIHPRLRAKFVPAKKCVHHAPMCHLSAGTQCYPDTNTLVRQHSVFKQIPSQVPTPNFLKCRHGNQETNCVFDGKITELRTRFHVQTIFLWDKHAMDSIISSVWNNYFCQGLVCGHLQTLAPQNHIRCMQSQQQYRHTHTYIH